MTTPSTPPTVPPKPALEGIEQKWDAAWEAALRNELAAAPREHVLKVTTFESLGGATHEVLEDGSVLLSGEAPDRDTYTVEVETDLGAWQGTVSFVLGPLPHGKELDEISTADLARLEERYDDVMIREGTAALMAAVAKPLGIEFNTAVQRIDIGQLLTSQAREVIRDAAAQAARWGDPDLDTDHLLWAVTRQEPVRRLPRDVWRVSSPRDRLTVRGTTCQLHP